MELSHFISDLALILITASVATLLFKWLKQPVVLGYIVAGFIAGPYFSWLPTVSEMENVEVWAEIGVIFLLFALGLEFSFKKLIAVGGTATVATMINMGSMIIIGYAVGQLLHWDTMDSIFLGGMLSMSSTTIIIKAFNDMGLQKQKFAGIVFGMLIVEDLAAILMMVMLSTVAVSNTIQGMELLKSLLKLVFFIMVWFIFGIYLIPTFLKKVKAYLNDETLIIVSIGLCLGMVLLASKVGFSAALGAFIMGSILAETVRARQIEHLVEPIKNLFGAVFFVSVGMLINPVVIKEYIGLILILTSVVLVGRVIFASLGVLASGEGLKVALQSGFSLAQIGEFSFIIASLGMSLGVISDTLYPIIVTVSIITTFTTPYFIKMAIPVSGVLEKIIPPKWTLIIDGYAAANPYKTVNKQGDWSKLLKTVIINVTVNVIICLAIFLLWDTFALPFITKHIPGIWGELLAALLALIFMGPFLSTIVRRKNHSNVYDKLWKDNHFNKGALISLGVIRLAISCFLILMVLITLFPSYTLLMVLISMALIGVIIFMEGFKQQSKRLEARFMENLNQKQLHDEKKVPILPETARRLLTHNIHIEEIDVSPQSVRIGKTLRELDFRGRLGLNIVSIIRGNRKINIPEADERIYPYDKLIVAGSDEDIQNLMKELDAINQAQCLEEDAQVHVSLAPFEVEEGSPMIGHSLRDLNIQQNTECMVITVERGEDNILPPAGFVLMKGDTLLLAGEADKLSSFGTNILKAF
ncbi:sodium:proton antiporter [Bacteroidia bacterium]|nr:sodium:proton antiporter [Bacteroidia bacterium]GHU56899.1 sodium:proton antiporter [Bacteroidia bacterium]